MKIYSSILIFIFLYPNLAIANYCCVAGECQEINDSAITLRCKQGYLEDCPSNYKDYGQEYWCSNCVGQPNTYCYEDSVKPPPEFICDARPEAAPEYCECVRITYEKTGAKNVCGAPPLTGPDGTIAPEECNASNPNIPAYCDAYISRIGEEALYAAFFAAWLDCADKLQSAHESYSANYQGVVGAYRQDVYHEPGIVAWSKPTAKYFENKCQGNTDCAMREWEACAFTRVVWSPHIEGAQRHLNALGIPDVTK